MLDVATVTDSFLELLSIVVSTLPIVETVVVDESLLEGPKTRGSLSFLSFVDLSSEFSWIFSSSLLSAVSISFSVSSSSSSS